MGLLDFFKEIPSTTQKVINYIGSLVPKVDVTAPAPVAKPLIQKYVDPKTLNPDTQPKLSKATGNELPADIFGNPIKPNKDPMLVALAKDIGGGFKDAGNIAKAVVQGTAQSGGSVALSSIFNAGHDELTTQEIADASPQLAKIKDIIFGPDPIKSIQKRIGETKTLVENKGGVPVPFTDKVVPTPKFASGPLAAIGVIGSIGLDFTGFGGEEKGVIKALTEANKIEDAAKILKEINVAKDLIPEYSKVFSELKDEKQVAAALENVKKIQETTQGAKTAETVVQETKKVKGVGSAVDETGKAVDVTFNTAKKERQFLQSVRDARPDVKVSIGGQYVPRSTDELAMKARNLIKTDIATAENLVRTGTDEKAVATASELIKHYSDEALKATSSAVRDALYEKASSTAHTIAEKLTEQGRAVQAASIMGRLTPEGMLKFAAREINKYNEAVDASRGLFGLKKKIPDLTSGQTKFILDEFKKIEQMEDGTKKAMAFKQLNDAIANLIPSSLYSKVVAVWKAGLLTGLKTSGVNTFSNLFNGVSETIKDVPAVAIDKVASLFTGERTIGLTARGTAGGVKEGFEKGLQYLRTGFDERNMATKLDYKRVNFGTSKVAKGLQKYEETIFHILGAEDQPFYYGAKARSLQSQAVAESINKGLKGSEAKKFIQNLVENPTDEMLRYAVNDAEMAVFQNDTMLSKIAKAAQNIPGGQFVVPFGKTPSAVAMQMVNYSPIGIAKTIVQNIGKGRFDQRMLAQGLARGITGTAVMYMGSQLYKNDMMNLSLPTGEKEQKLWQAEGRTPNSIKIGGKWRNANTLGPIGMALLVGGGFEQGLKDTGSPFKALVQSVASGAKSLTDQTFLQGLSAILDALNDPSRFVQGYFANTIASVVPTLVGDLAKGFDTVERRSPGILDRVKAKIPGLRQTLEPQVTNLGQYRVKGGNWIETLIDPSRPSNILTTPVTDELRRMTDVGYNVSPTQLGDKNGYAVLTPKQNTELWKKSGELIDSKLGNLIKLDQYKKLSDEKKAKIIEEVVSTSKVMARIQAVMDLTEGLQGQELKAKLGELKKGGLMTQEVFNGWAKLQ